MEHIKNGAPNIVRNIRGSNSLDNYKVNENPPIIDLLDLNKDFLSFTEKNENPFPTEVFPECIQEVIFEAENKFQFSVDYLGAGILSAISASIGTTYKLEVKKGWLQKCNLYMVIVGRTGDAKSPAMELCFKPIRDREDLLYKKFEEELKEYEESLENDQNKLTKPFLERFLINDFTPEALIQVHSNNKRGVCIIIDELHGWIKNFNRYNNSGEEQAYLTFWSGGSITIDRASGKCIRLKDPFIGVMGSTQISVLKEFAKGGRSANGFMDRLLFVFPENQKTIKWNINQVDERILHNYSTVLSNLMDLKMNENNESNIIPIEEKAKKYLFDWQNSLPDNYFFEYERSIGIKLQEYVFRFALILQLLFHASENSTDREVQLFAVKGGIKLFDYFYFNAIKVRSETIKKNYRETLSEAQKAILDDLPSKKSFTTAEGLKIACKIVNGKPRVSERQFYTYLKDLKLFKKLERGVYQKLV